MLKSFWEESLKFDYSYVFEKPQTAQEGIDCNMAWTRYCEIMKQKLQKIEIAAPDLTRKISDKEAKGLVYFCVKRQER